MTGRRPRYSSALRCTTHLIVSDLLHDLPPDLVGLPASHPLREHVQLVTAQILRHDAWRAHAGAAKPQKACACTSAASESAASTQDYCRLLLRVLTHDQHNRRQQWLRLRQSMHDKQKVGLLACRGAAGLVTHPQDASMTSSTCCSRYGAVSQFRSSSQSVQWSAASSLQACRPPNSARRHVCLSRLEQNSLRAKQSSV